MSRAARKRPSALPPGRPRPRGREKSFLRRGDLALRRSWRENHKLAALVIVAGFTLLVMLAAVFGEQGVLRVRQLKRERLVLEERVASLEGETDGLRQEVRKMRTDPFSYEKAARERLGYGKKGEFVYDFRDDPLEPGR